MCVQGEGGGGGFTGGEEVGGFEDTHIYIYIMDIYIYNGPTGGEEVGGFEDVHLVALEGTLVSIYSIIQCFDIAGVSILVPICTHTHIQTI